MCGGGGGGGVLLMETKLLMLEAFFLSKVDPIITEMGLSEQKNVQEVAKVIRNITGILP